jgi:hypothetical protein
LSKCFQSLHMWSQVVVRSPAVLVVPPECWPIWQ